MSTRSPRMAYSQLSEDLGFRSSSSTSHLPKIYAPGTEGTSPTKDLRDPFEHQGSNYDVVPRSEDITLDTTADETGYLGQLCEVHWLRSLHTRLQTHGPTPSSSIPQISDTNFYLDNHGIRLLHQDNPFFLPIGHRATALFEHYFRTVHTTFLIVPSDIETQLQVYYRSLQSGQPVAFPQRWYAIVNLIFAISARFVHLTHSEWSADALEETLYLSRAYQLLGLNDTALVLATPDLTLIQVKFRYAYSLNLLTSAGFSITRLLLYVHWAHQSVSMILRSLLGESSNRPHNFTKPLIVATK
jgi:hypothetical protein